jgi:hypothetical protein
LPATPLKAIIEDTEDINLGTLEDPKITKSLFPHILRKKMKIFAGLDPSLVQYRLILKEGAKLDYIGQAEVEKDASRHTAESQRRSHEAITHQNGG